MATTKKVAGTSLDKSKKRISPKAVKVNEPAVRKVTTKKSSSAKIASVPIKNNTSAKLHASSTAAKLKKVEDLLHSKKHRSSDSSGAFLKEKANAAKPAVALALLSPYRFPVDIDKIAVNTARFGGVFFVIVGAVFTVFFANTALSPAGQLTASTITAPLNLLEQTQDRDASAATSTPTVDPKPKADFRLNNPDEVTGMAEVVVKVPYADVVTLMAYYKTQREDIILGRLRKVSDDTWSISIDTTKYADGEYKLKALIKNAYGTYEESHDTYVVIANRDVTVETVLSKSSERNADTNIDTEETGADEEDNNVSDLTENPPDESVGIVAPVHQTLDQDIVKNRTAPLSPEIKVSLEEGPLLTGTVPVKIEVTDALAVEVFALPKNSLIQHYLGTAKKINDKTWQYPWETTASPNGEYRVTAYVRNVYGTYSKETPLYTVSNQIAVTYTDDEQRTIEKLTAVVQEETQKDSIVTLPAQVEIALQEATTTPTGSLVVNVRDDILVTPESEDIKTFELSPDFKKSLQSEFNRLSSALRVKDENAIFEIRERINTLKTDAAEAQFESSDNAETATQIDEYFSQGVRRIEEDVVRMEKVISERTTLKAETDSDKDGIADYDELALYGTDPFSGDTDGDGFIDGAEILGGYNPVDASSEVLIAYESPQEAGIVREDVFIVESITAASANEDTPEAKPAAVLSGKGLPNSFVTLYIFSTPVVVTLKTDKDGNWIYRFEKELEDGEHQVYVGITDNAGKLVAKSNPFAFVKEAQAFTAINSTQQPAAVPAEDGSFVSQYMLYMILSISVVAIGLVLILLGLHLDTRQRKFKTASGVAEGAV